MKALILAGGFGKRLRIAISDVPKPMAPIAGKPFLEHQIRHLKEQGVEDIILCIHYMADKIKSYFGDGKKIGVNITYSEEENPLGTGGAIKLAQKYIGDTFIVLNGDTYSKIDIKDLMEFHRSRNSKFTMCLTTSKNALASGNVIVEGDRIKNFVEKQDIGTDLINSGVYVLEPEIFDYIEMGKNVSLEREVFPKLAENKLLYGYKYNGYFIDIGLPETYSQFKRDIIQSGYMKKENTVRDALRKINTSGVNLALVVDSDEKLLGIINERVINEYIFKGGNLDEPVERIMIKDPLTVGVKDDKNKVYETLLMSATHVPVLDDEGRVVDVEFYSEKLKIENFPILRGRAPLRIGFAGGGTDIKYYFEKFGGVVINATIDKYCNATIIKRADKKIVIDSDTTDQKDVIVESIGQLKYDGSFDLIKAIINVMKPDFGFELYLHNDIPPGRGLGSSASLAVLIISLISQLKGVKYDDYKIAELAYKAEREELGINGGWQDQYASVTGGFNFMEFSKDKTLIYPLRLKEEVINELNSHLLLCYVGKSHSSGEIHKNQQEKFEKNEDEIITNLGKLKEIAIEIRDSLLTNRLDKIGALLHESWQNKRKLSDKTSNSSIDNLYEIGLKNGASGGRLLGAGDGGYLLFFVSPKRRNQLTKTLNEFGGEVMNFNFDFKGTQIWNVNNFS